MQFLGYSPILRVEDIDWLLADAPGRAFEADRRLAIDASVRIWRETGQSLPVLARIEEVARQDSAMVQAYENATQLPLESPEPIDQERELKDIRDSMAEEQARREAVWTGFVDGIRRNPERLRQLPPPGPGGADGRLLNLWYLLTRTVSTIKGYAIESVESLTPLLGADVTLLLRDALIRHWRAWRPTLKSGRKISRRNEMSYSDCMGITGVTLEAKSEKRWAEALTSDDAVRAAGYATIEPSGLPSWLSDLALAKPDEVQTVLKAETVAALSSPELQNDVLNGICVFGGKVMELMAPVLLEELEQRDDLPIASLERILEIISRGLSTNRERFMKVALERFVSVSAPYVGALYVGALFNIDAAAATNALVAKLDLLEPPDQKALVERLLPRVFGSRLLSPGSSPGELPFDALERLVWIAFKTIRVEEDNRREYGVSYTPDERDEVEEARGHAFNWLANTPGRAAFEALLRLVVHPDRPAPRARLLAIAHDRAAKDSESAPWRPSETSEFEKNFETAPYTAKDLQLVALRRIADIQHELLHGDFAQSPTLRLLRNETAVQNWVAERLWLKQGRSYSVEREPHVVDEKEPDVRLRTKASDAGVAIEIKVAESWTLSELETALEDQLCGRYFRARDARHGILLLVHQKARPIGWLQDGSPIGFDQVVDHLKKLAAGIAGRSPEAPQPEIAVIDVSESAKKKDRRL